MILDKYLGKNLDDVFSEMKQQRQTLDYAKVDESEYIKICELGFYLCSYVTKGQIDTYRIYLKNIDSYVPHLEIFSPDEGLIFLDYNSVLANLGDPDRVVRALKFPGVIATLPALEYVRGDKKIRYSFDENNEISYITVSIC